MVITFNALPNSVTKVKNLGNIGNMVIIVKNNSGNTKNPLW